MRLVGAGVPVLTERRLFKVSVWFTDGGHVDYTARDYEYNFEAQILKLELAGGDGDGLLFIPARGTFCWRVEPFTDSKLTEEA